MTFLRIDNLRGLLASVGQQQIAYWEFFKEFSDRLEISLGEYLGDPSCVALCCAEGDFDFDQGSYRQAGLGFKDGKFLVPLMFRMQNLKDEGDTQIRIHLFFTLEDEHLVAEFTGKTAISMSKSTSNITPLLEYIYDYLIESCSKSTWFAQNSTQYQNTKIGFFRPGEITV